MVRATDPSGVPQAVRAVDTNSDEVMVTITLTDVNEAPVVDRRRCSDVPRGRLAT